MVKVTKKEIKLDNAEEAIDMLAYGKYRDFTEQLICMVDKQNRVKEKLILKDEQET